MLKLAVKKLQKSLIMKHYWITEGVKCYVSIELRKFIGITRLKSKHFFLTNITKRLCFLKNTQKKYRKNKKVAGLVRFNSHLKLKKICFCTFFEPKFQKMYLPVIQCSSMLSFSVCVKSWVDVQVKVARLRKASWEVFCSFYNVRNSLLWL